MEIVSVSKCPFILNNFLIFFRENNDYVALGKHGLAVIGSSDRNIYELIGYKEKTNILFRININNSFSFYNQKDNFSTFYDSDSLNWLVKFEGNDQEEFTKIFELYDVKIINKINSSETTTSKSLDTEKVMTAPKPELPQKPVLNTNKDDSQSDSSGSKQRANILNRMAKMGHAILPKSDIKNTSTELSDSDEEKTHERRIPPRQIKKAAAERISKQIINSNTESNLMNDKIQQQILPNEMFHSQMLPNHIYNPNIVPSQAICNPSQLYNPQLIPSTMYHPNWNNDGLNQYIIAQNTELKLNLAQISNKLDTVLNTKKTDFEEVDKNVLLSRLKTMKLKTENLESSLQNSEEQYSTLKSKYTKIEEKLQNTVGMESKNKEIEILEKTISALKVNLVESQEKYDSNKSEIKLLENKVKELDEIIEAQKQQLQEYENLNKEENNVAELNETIEDLNKSIDILKLKQKDLEDYFEKSEAEKKETTQINNTKIKSLDEIVKRHMNDMYQSILDNFQEEGSYNFSNIQMSVAKSLKVTSFKIIQDCVNIFKESNEITE